MIGRTWRGWTRARDIDAYAGYVAATGLVAYRATPGNRGAWIMTRVTGDRAEILTVSLWDDMEAVRAFAGEDPGRAVFYPEDDRYLVDRELTAVHWSVLPATAEESDPG